MASKGIPRGPPFYYSAASTNIWTATERNWSALITYWRNVHNIYNGQWGYCTFNKIIINI